MGDSSTIAAIASPPGMGAISLIRVSGADCLSIANRLFARFPDAPEPRRQYLCRWQDSEGCQIDEGLVSYFPAPHSFTGEHMLEMSGHGGMAVTQASLERLFELGATPAEPGEFSQRAFLNGKVDLTQAEAIMDLISAQTSLAIRAASQQLGGALSQQIEALRLDLIEVTAHVEAYIDFPDEDIDLESRDRISRRITTAVDSIHKLLATADRGKILREGIKTVLCGAPNAGKSSLLNQLLGYDRAIVTDRPGTTRDTIEESINLAGIPLVLTDTAGIRDSSDEIEAEGIERSRSQVQQAELVLIVVDRSQPKNQSPAIAAPDGARVVTILNKSDLEPHPDWLGGEATGIAVSCTTGEGIDELRSHLLREITGSASGFDRGDLVSINTRHQHYLRSALDGLTAGQKQLTAEQSPEFVAFELREALDAIGAVVGKTDIEEILGSIFSTFCIGK